MNNEDIIADISSECREGATIKKSGGVAIIFTTVADPGPFGFVFVGKFKDVYRLLPSGHWVFEGRIIVHASPEHVSQYIEEDE